MPRVNRVGKARKDQGTCSACGCEIKKGDPYVWWKFNFSSYRNKRCVKSECYPKASELTRSEFTSTMLEHEDAFAGIRSELAVDTLSSVADELSDLAREIESYGDEQEEKKNNMPEQLQDSDVGQMLQDRADDCREIASSLEDASSAIEELSANTIEETDGMDVLGKALAESMHVGIPEREKGTTDEEWAKIFEGLRVEHNDAVVSEAEDAFDNVDWSYS